MLTICYPSPDTVSSQQTNSCMTVTKTSLFTLVTQRNIYPSQYSHEFMFQKLQQWMDGVMQDTALFVLLCKAQENKMCHIRACVADHASQAIAEA